MPADGLRRTAAHVGKFLARSSARGLSGNSIMTRRNAMMKRALWIPLGLTLLNAACVMGQTSQPAEGNSLLRDAPVSVTLFQNVRIFDGKSGKLSAPSNLLVRGDKIERISTDPIPTDRRADTALIDGGGRTLMPGLIDA